MLIQPAAFFGIGFNEFMLLTLLALVVIGPKRLPEVARGLGKLLAQFRRATSDLRDAVNTEINASPELRDLKQVRDELSGDMRGLGQKARDYMSREFDKEQEALGSVERDMHGVANDIGGAVRTGQEEAEAAGKDAESSEQDRKPADGEAGTGGEAGSGGDAAPAREPWDVQMNKLFFRDKIAAGEMAASGMKGGGESPEDDYVAERDGDAGGNTAAAPAEEPESKPAPGAEPTESPEPSTGKPA